MKPRSHMSDPLNVLFLTPIDRRETPADSSDGVDENRLSRELQCLGVNATFLSPYRVPLNPLANWNFFVRSLDLFRAIVVMLRYRHCDAVISIFESGGLFILLLRRLFFFRPPVMLWDASIGNAWRVVRLIQDWTFPRYDRFLMLTTSQVKYLEKEAKPGAVIRQIGYQIDEDFFHPRTNREGKYVLTVGDDESRDFETLVASLNGTGVPTVLKTRWVPSAESTLETDQMRFVPERLADPEYRRLYEDAAFVVIPLKVTEHPGGITALFEAMAMGKAVVISDSPIARDFVRDGETGFVVGVRDREAMREAIVKLWRDPVLRKTMGDHARKTVEQTWSTKDLANKLLAVVRLSG